MKTRSLKIAVMALAVVAMTLGACKKKPKDSKAKDGDQAMSVMKATAMAAMKADAMKAAAMGAMKADAMKAGKVAKRAATSGQGLTIKFDRPMTVGLKFKLSATGGSENKMTLNGKPMSKESEKSNWLAEAEVTVKAIHTSGKATKAELKIVKFQQTNKAGAAKELLPAGTLVLAEVEAGKEKFTVKGKAVSKAAAGVLKDLVNLYDGDPTTTDDLFGPGGPKKPGDTWKPNTAKLLDSLKKELKGATLWPKPGDATGKVTFVAAKKVNGVDALVLDIQVNLKNIAPAMGPVKATAGTMTIKFSGWMPADPKTPVGGSLKRSMDMHVEAGFKKGGKDHKMVINAKHFMQSTTTLIK